MGKKFIFDPTSGLHVEVTDEQLNKLRQDHVQSLRKSGAQPQVSSEYSIGKMALYEIDGVERIGKIFNFDKKTGNVILAKVIGKSRGGGYQFSGTDIDSIPTSSIKRLLPNV